MATLSDLGYQHGLSGSACPVRIKSPAYEAGFIAGWMVRTGGAS